MPLYTRPTDLDQTRLQSQLATYGLMGGDITYDEFKYFTDTGHDEAILANAVQLASLEGLKIGDPLKEYLLTGKEPTPTASAEEGSSGSDSSGSEMIETSQGLRPSLPGFPGMPDLRGTPPQDAFEAMTLGAQGEQVGDPVGGEDTAAVDEAEPVDNEFDLAAYTKDLFDRFASQFGGQTITIQNTMDEQLAEQNKIMKQQLEQQQRMMIAQRVGQANMDRASRQAQLQFGGQRGAQTGTSGFKRSSGFRAFRPATSIGLAIGGSTTSNANRTINI